MGFNDLNWMEAIQEQLRGNPTVGNTNAVTINRGTTIAGSFVLSQAYGGVTWQQYFYCDASSQVVAISAVTTL